ncbi:hypothetical protein ACHAWF_005895 [Thalassiosira exigua]
MYELTHGDSWKRSNSWANRGVSACLWYGVTCDSSGSRMTVSRLELGANSLRGPLPLGDLLLMLPNMKVLDLRNNSLTGILPDNVAKSSGLERLLLANNQLWGGTLGPLGDLPRLAELDLSGKRHFNSLSGTVPNLVQDFLAIDVADNDPTGINREACRNVGWNDGNVGLFGCDGIACPVGTAGLLGRRTPQSTCDPCPQNRLYVGVVGCDDGSPSPTQTPALTAPPSLPGSPSLLFYPPPTPFPSPVPYNANGVTPISLQNENEFAVLTKFYTNFGGESWLRREYWTLWSVNICEWYGLRCNDQGHIVCRLAEGLARAARIGPGRNLIAGTIPEGVVFGPYHDGLAFKLEKLVMPSNLLRRAIPISLSRLPTLRELDLRENSFTSFRISGDGYEGLSNLQLDDNEITGTIHHDMHLMTELEVISMSRNKLMGYIPPDLPELKRIERIDMTFNRLSGVVPDLSSKTLAIDVAGNKLTGIDPGACLHEQWNQGNVGRYGCDGIACPAGTYNKLGRRTYDSACVPCPSDIFIGSVGCNIAPSPSPCTLECLNGGFCKNTPFSVEWCTCPLGFSCVRCESESSII